MKTPNQRQDSTPVECEVLLPDAAAVKVDPAALVARINDHHARAQNDAAHARAYADSSGKAALLAGLQLVELKAMTPHGQWEILFARSEKRIGKSNAKVLSHLDFSSRTAANYIAFATHLVSKRLQPEQSAVLMELSRGGEITADAAALLDEITPPGAQRRAYLELGIYKPTPKEAAAMAAETDDQKPSDSGPTSPAATKLRSAKDSARCDWFGTHKVGRVEPGSIVGMVLTELADPAKGSLRLLSKDDLESIAADFRNLAKRATELAKEK